MQWKNLVSQKPPCQSQTSIFPPSNVAINCYPSKKIRVGSCAEQRSERKKIDRREVMRLLGSRLHASRIPPPLQPMTLGDQG